MRLQKEVQIGWPQYREHARWKNYPNLNHGAKESESISGLVLHALNLALGEEVRTINSNWLETLPDRIVQANDGESYYIEVPTKSGMAVDHFVQLKMPWLVVATVDAFPDGNVSERAKALKWLEDTLSTSSVAEADKENNWWRAEVLYALNYVARHAPKK